ncbi:MAG: hypothetical protein M3Z24_02775, partial [Chloroflexota bacterium]|nr:hypothetical protein [Chloroflexota bacterium]
LYILVGKQHLSTDDISSLSQKHLSVYHVYMYMINSVYSMDTSLSYFLKKLFQRLAVIIRVLQM